MRLQTTIEKSNCRIYALHGFLGRSDDWTPFEFVDHAAVIKGDKLNFWQWSARFNDDVSKRAFKNILLGYSLGGRLAMHALLSKPGLWDGAILISAHPGLESNEERKLRIINDEKWANRFLNDEWEQLVTDWNSNPVFGSRHFVMQKYEKDFDRTELAFQLKNWSLGMQEPLLNRLKDLEIPMLVIAGKEDVKFCKVAEQFRDFATISIIENAAHRVPWDQPNDFKREVIGFVKKISN